MVTVVKPLKVKSALLRTLLRLLQKFRGLVVCVIPPHPLEFSDDLIQCYRDLPQWCFASAFACTKWFKRCTVQAMKRNHTIDVYIDKIAKIT